MWGLGGGGCGWGVGGDEWVGGGGCVLYVALLYLCGTDYVNFYDIIVDVTVPIPAKPFDLG